mgnify:CR=1 FL=1
MRRSKMKTTAGVGKFTGIGSVRDLLGHYANAETHAGAEKSAAAFAAWLSGRDWPHATVGKPRRPG